MANSGLNLNYDRLLQSVGDSLDKGRSEAAIAVNISSTKPDASGVVSAFTVPWQNAPHTKDAESIKDIPLETNLLYVRFFISIIYHRNNPCNVTIS